MSIVNEYLEGGLRLGHLDTYDNEENVILKTFSQGDNGLALHLLYLCSFGQQKRAIFESDRRKLISFKTYYLYGCWWPPTYSNCLILTVFQFGSFFLVSGPSLVEPF
jgi:hypothetical protein